jgi:uncharacterized protein YbjT (DUF2867 family)
MNILVTGATGYIGGRLVPHLQEKQYAVRCLARDARRLDGRFPGVEIVEGDVLDDEPLRAACEGIDVAYYLIHSMGASGTFSERDREAATKFGSAARKAGVKKIIYLGGLGSDDVALSRHLRSRHEVGQVLSDCGVPVLEFRAAMIVGSGSVSFEMMRYLTERLPVMIAPKWVITRAQPIGIQDVLAYLLAALDIPATTSRIYEIGGADIVTYRDMMLRYARLRGLERLIIIVPLFTARLSSYWVHLVTPISARLAQPLILGLHNEVVVKDDAARLDFPSIEPFGFDAAVRSALDRYRTSSSETTWFDGAGSRELSADFTGEKEGMFVDRRSLVVNAPSRDVALVFTSLGGEHGWLYANFLWRLRGMLDLLVGGVGARRGRRSPSELRLGDAVDFWRVDAYEPQRSLRLRSEMKLPGRAWLQFDAEPLDDGRTCLRQTAFFEPRGFWGSLYWYGVMPFHALVFANMASRIRQRAENISPRSVAVTR